MTINIKIDDVELTWNATLSSIMTWHTMWSHIIYEVEVVCHVLYKILCEHVILAPHHQYTVDINMPHP